MNMNEYICSAGAAGIAEEFLLCLQEMQTVFFGNLITLGMGNNANEYFPSTFGKSLGMKKI